MKFLHWLFGHDWHSVWVKDARGTFWQETCRCGETRWRDAKDYHPGVRVG